MDNKQENDWSKMLETKLERERREREERKIQLLFSHGSSFLIGYVLGRFVLELFTLCR